MLKYGTVGDAGISTAENLIHWKGQNKEQLENYSIDKAKTRYL